MTDASRLTVKVDLSDEIRQRLDAMQEQIDKCAIQWNSMESGERPDLVSRVLCQNTWGGHFVGQWREYAQAFEDDEGCLTQNVVAWAYIPPWDIE